MLLANEEMANAMSGLDNLDNHNIFINNCAALPASCPGSLYPYRFSDERGIIHFEGTVELVLIQLISGDGIIFHEKENLFTFWKFINQMVPAKISSGFRHSINCNHLTEFFPENSHGRFWAACHDVVDVPCDQEFQ